MKISSAGSIYFYFKLQAREEIEEWYVYRSEQEKHAKRGVVKTAIRLVCLSLQNGRYELETTEHKFHNYSKVVESTNLPLFNKDTPKTL